MIDPAVYIKITKFKKQNLFLINIDPLKVFSADVPLACCKCLSLDWIFSATLPRIFPGNLLDDRFMAFNECRLYLAKTRYSDPQSTLLDV